MQLDLAGTADARLSVADPVFERELIARIASHASISYGPRRNWRSITPIAMGVAILVLIVSLAVPRVAHWLAPFIPQAWEESAGRHIAEAVIDAAHATSGRAQRTCAAADGMAALRRLTDRLAAAADSSYSVRVQAIPQQTVNALAMPGGHIVIFSGLLDFAETPDEIAGVLAHEMAHVTHRHMTASALRGLGYALIFDLLSGGSAGGVIGFGHELLTLAHSRDAEIEADATGLKILERAGIGAHGFVAFWDRMRNRERGDKDNAINPPVLFSTHPDSESRALLARSARQTGTPALTAEEWQALKAFCAG
jgi:Zn-dependent protease with chaperone function